MNILRPLCYRKLFAELLYSWTITIDVLFHQSKGQNEEILYALTILNLLKKVSTDILRDRHFLLSQFTYKARRIYA